MTALLKLRDYQTAAIREIHTKWNAGITRPAVVLPTGAGKGHPLDTQVPTPSGLRAWGELKAGDFVFGSGGQPTEVIAVHDRGILPTYRVTFSDGASVEVDGDHLWQVRDNQYRRTSREYGIIETRALIGSSLRLDRGYRWHIPMARARSQMGAADLPLDPYLIGSLVANGSLAGVGTMLTTPDRDVAARVAKVTQANKINDQTPGICDRYSLPGLTKITKALGMRVKSGQKRIPRIYLDASVADRIDLLHGLMDGDGTRRDLQRRSVSYSTTSPGLADDMVELVTSLGGTANVKVFARADKPTEYALGIIFPSGIEPFSSGRKGGAGTQSIRNLQPRRAIVSVDYIGDKPIRCIQVAAKDSLYLITRQHIVTHNTVVFTHLAERFLRSNPGKRVLILAHTDELVLQAKAKMHEVAPHRVVGIVKAAQNEVHAEIVVASVQSLRSKARRDKIKAVGLIIVDECFPAGTLVGGRPIEDLKPGDMVPCWDEATGEQTWRPVVATMKRAPERMVRVELEDGTEFACTPNHPILTEQGWCPAGMLLHGEQVVSFTHDANASASASELHGMQYGVRSQDSEEVSPGCLPKDGQGVLLGSVPRLLGEPGFVGQDGAHEPGARVGAHEAQQPHGSAGSPREDVADIAGDPAQAAFTGREWSRSPGAAAQAGFTSGVADRGHDRPEGRGTSVSLQSGHRASDDEGDRRGGRGVPFLAGPPSLRSAPGFQARRTRVADVQILEPGGDGTYGGVCRDGLVYNIEVAGTHTYLIGETGVVAHNCHHASARTYMNILEHYGAIFPEVDGIDTRVRSNFGPTLAVGFTATLVRADDKKLSDVWQDVAFRLSIAFMIRAGYLLDVKGKRVEVPELDLKKVKTSGGDYQEGQLADALVEAMAPQIVAKKYLEHASDRKGIGFAPTVESAYIFSEAFRDLGITSEVVHGALAKDERRAVLARLKSGETQVCWSVMALTEGFDEPTVSCAIMARPTKSSGLWQQMVGRVLRPDLSLPPAERGHALLLDVTGVGRLHGLQSLVDLSARDDLPEDVDEDLSLLELEDLILDEEAEVETGTAEPTLYYMGPAETVEFDPLGRDSDRTWGRTPDGHYYLSCGTNGYVFLTESLQGEPGSYDLVWCNATSARMTEHTAVHLEMGIAWGEEVAIELGGFGSKTLTAKKAKWRDEPATKGQAWKVRNVPGWGGAKIRTVRVDPLDQFSEVKEYRIGTPDGEILTKGKASEIIDAHTAAQRIDPLVRAVKASL